jgi:hypothetical protein
LFGKEIISNTIDSNIYTTSNAVKGVTQYQCPFFKKHSGFYCTISTAININGTTYYKYDVDLRNYARLQSTPVPNLASYSPHLRSIVCSEVMRASDDAMAVAPSGPMPLELPNRGKRKCR